MANCTNCGSPNNPCTGISGISWDSAITSCLSRLGVTDNMALAVAIGNIAASVCELLDAEDTQITCEDILIPGTYANIGFNGTGETTLCDLIGAIDTRFSTILDYNPPSYFVTDCFGDADTIPTKITEIVEKLCVDLYNTSLLKFLPLAGNATNNLQHEYYMLAGANIIWYVPTLTGNPSITGDTTGVQANAGLNSLGHSLPWIFGTPIRQKYAKRIDISVLTAATIFNDQDSMPPNAIVDKSTVVSIFLPTSVGMVIANPIVQFTALQIGSTIGATKIYPAGGSGNTVAGVASLSFHLYDWVTLCLVGTDWKLIDFGLV